jgi:hypothetical protein
VNFGLCDRQEDTMQLTTNVANTRDWLNAVASQGLIIKADLYSQSETVVQTSRRVKGLSIGGVKAEVKASLEESLNKNSDVWSELSKY